MHDASIARSSFYRVEVLLSIRHGETGYLSVPGETQKRPGKGGRSVGNGNRAMTRRGFLRDGARITAGGLWIIGSGQSSRGRRRRLPGRHAHEAGSLVWSEATAPKDAYPNDINAAVAGVCKRCAAGRCGRRVSATRIGAEPGRAGRRRRAGLVGAHEARPDFGGDREAYRGAGAGRWHGVCIAAFGAPCETVPRAAG